MIRLIRKTLATIRSTNHRRRLLRQFPELAHFDEAERAAKTKHARVSHIQKARKAFMVEALAGRAK